MIEILQSILPIYLMVIIGWAAVRSGYFEAGHIAPLSLFALKVALPALIVFAVALPHGEGTIQPAFLVAYLVGSLATMGLGFLAMRLVLKQPARDAWSLGFGMAISNSGYLGFPIASLVFGPEAAVVFAMAVIVENVVMIPLAQVLASVSGERGQALGPLIRAALQRMLRNPLLITAALALAWRATGLSPGAAVERGVQMLAMAASPLALFVVGGTVATMTAGGYWRRTTGVALGKLVLHPLLVGALLLTLPGVPASMVPIGILFAAVPMVTVYPILIAPFGLREVGAAILIATTTASVVTVTVVLALVGML